MGVLRVVICFEGAIVAGADGLGLEEGVEDGLVVRCVESCSDRPVLIRPRGAGSHCCPLPSVRVMIWFALPAGNRSVLPVGQRTSIWLKPVDAPSPK